MAKKGKLKSYAKVKGEGKDCPKGCGKMQRRERIKPPVNKTYYFKEWDYCPSCSHLQHYDEFKSDTWQEEERQRSFLRSI